MKWVVSLWEIYWYHLTQIIIERWPHIRQWHSEQHSSQRRRPLILSHGKYENSCSRSASHCPAHRLIISQHLFTTTFRASMMSQTRPDITGTSEFHTQSIWSMHYNDSKLQIPHFWRIQIFWNHRAFWKHGNATMQNWKHNWEDVLSKQTDWNCDDHNLREFLQLELSSQLVTVILLLRITILIIMSTLAVSVIASLPKKTVVIAIIWW